ncbi:MAG TPA: adenylate/guanylate cyclase domain-containing protein [Bacteroidota bacterium]|nr:adenylate/guanylate cyclase domain-containing protein [Bacteroidota bacterium]
MPGPEEHGTRRLAAIMFTDMKGFSLKMQENEERAFEILRNHDTILKEIVVKHGGRMIKSVGDAFMVDFPSAVNAVKCSIEAQETFWKYNQDKSDFDKIEIRIGIHLGDVIDVGNDVYGDGVNIAARIESITEPNRICVSQDIFSQIKNKLPIKAARIGQVELKNISEPIEVFELLIESIPELSTPSKKALQADELRKAEAAAKAEAEEAERIQTSRRKHEEEQAVKAQEHFAKAERLFEKGQIEEAEAEIEEVFRYVPVHGGAQSLQLKIDAYRFQKQEEERVRRAEEARKELDEKQKKIEGIIERAQQLSSEERFDEALGVLQEVFAIDSNHPAGRELETMIHQAIKAKEDLKAAPQPAEIVTQEEIPAQVTQRPRPQTVFRPRKRYIPWGKIIGWVLTLTVIGSGILLYPTIEQTFFPKVVSIVVLPNDPLNTPEDQRYITTSFSSLLAEELGRQANLSVIAPSSVISSRLRSLSLSQISKEFNVDFALLVQFDEDQGKTFLRLQLLRLGTEQRTWSSRLEYSLASVGELIPRIIAGVIQGTEIKGGNPQMVSLSSNTMALDLFWRAIPLLEYRQTDSVAVGIRLLEEALQLDAGFITANAYLARALLIQYDLSGEADRELLVQALQRAQSVISKEPTNPRANTVIGIVLRHSGRYAEANEFLTHALEEQPSNAPALRQKALLEVVRGDYSRAAQYAERALSVDPKHPNSQLVRGIIHQFAKEYSSALTRFDNAVNVGGNPVLLTNRYRLSAWSALNMVEEALRYGQDLLRRDPADFRVYYWIGRSFQLAGKAFESKEYLEKGVELALKAVDTNPNDWNAWSYLGLLYSRAGKFEDGEKAMSRAEELNSKSALVMYRRAALNAVQNKKAEAFQALRRAVETDFMYWEVLSPDFLLYAREDEFTRAIARRLF